MQVKTASCDSVTHSKVAAECVPDFPGPEVHTVTRVALPVEDVDQQPVPAAEVHEGDFLIFVAAAFQLLQLLLLLLLPDQYEVGGDGQILVDKLLGVRALGPILKKKKES